jgi:DNA mismatch endonuclease (patch repair protein)
MATIKGRGNRSTEIKLLVLIKAAGLTGWRRHVNLPGKPDFAFPRLKVAVFCDGDFWHGNPRTYKPPKTNVEFWEAKVRYNRSHDREVTGLLRQRGWRVVRVWESDLRKKPRHALARIRRALVFANRHF